MNMGKNIILHKWFKIMKRDCRSKLLPYYQNNTDYRLQQNFAETQELTMND